MGKRGIALVSLFLIPRLSVQQGERVSLRLDTSEADAVLSILDKRAERQQVEDTDWQRLFASNPYRRLKERESSMHRPLRDDDFKGFVASLDSRRQELRNTLTSRKQANLTAIAQRPLAYLPAEAKLRATVYPVIKPQTNSFVFQASTDAAIFLYLDPEESRAQFENKVAHELHHIGVASFDEEYEQRIGSLPENAREAARWMGALGEGVAVLAAAGSPYDPPLAAYPEPEQCAWRVQMDRAAADLDELNQFFLDIVHGDVRNEAIEHEASTFFGYRGPWYTVGYLMATTIEKQLGRPALISTLRDPRVFVAKYNEAAASQKHQGGVELPVFRKEILDAVTASSSAPNQ